MKPYTIDVDTLILINGKIVVYNLLVYDVNRDLLYQLSHELYIKVH